MSTPAPERYLSEAVRKHIEQDYYLKVNEQSRLENMIRDPEFWGDIRNRPAFFSDHGVVHVRDIARQILVVLETINGVLIPARSSQAMEFLYSYGVALAYLHDIGMRDLSQFGRKMHPEFAAQAVFDGSLDEVIGSMWEQDCGAIAKRIRQLSDEGVLQRDPQVIFRELLALSLGHSKSKVPVDVLNDPALFRAQMQSTLGQDLHDLYRRQRAAKGLAVESGQPGDQPPPVYLARYYRDFAAEAFDWMTAGSESTRALLADVTDTLRALRCADALRQRGTVQKTSGGNEVFASPQTGNALISLLLKDRLYLLEIPDELKSAGEANIAGSELDADGNLRLSFHRGDYANQAALAFSVRAVAAVIDDMLLDVVVSFQRDGPLDALKSSAQMQVFLERTDDNPAFVELVQAELGRLDPQLLPQLQIAPSLRNVSEKERQRYMQARALDWDPAQRQAFLKKVEEAGQKLDRLDLLEGFKHVKVAELQPGEYLIEAGAPSAFVYFPLGEGLKIIPLGGYESFSIAAWIPLGSTGVIRNDIRNADIVADQALSVLILPKEIYLRYWYGPYSPLELSDLLRQSNT